MRPDGGRRLPNLGNTYQSYLQDSWRIGNSGRPITECATTSSRSGRPASAKASALQPAPKADASLRCERALRLYRAVFRTILARKRQPRAALAAEPAVTADRSTVRSQTRTRHPARARRPHPNRPGRPRFSRLAEERQRLIDDTQVGVTLLHQDINYVLGPTLAGGAHLRSTARAQRPRVLFVAHVDSLNSGCETQLLAPCFGQPTGFTPADHEQRYSVTGGILVNDRRGGWFSADGEYGSGLSSAICPPGAPEILQGDAAHDLRG